MLFKIALLKVLLNKKLITPKEYNRAIILLEKNEKNAEIT